MSVGTSACVDCATTIIGECLRCPACHARHAVEVTMNAPVVSTTSVSPQRETFGHVLIAWVVAAEIVAMVVCGLLLAVKECR